MFISASDLMLIERTIIEGLSGCNCVVGAELEDGDMFLVATMWIGNRKRKWRWCVEDSARWVRIDPPRVAEAAIEYFNE